jgi:erythritol transport system ATP-binding protein
MSAIPAMPVLEARGVTRRFGATQALSDVDFRIAPGRVHALIGENGAGKSTLVRILSGVDRPSSGAVLVDGHEVAFTSTREARTHGIDLIHQELQLFPDLSVTENLFLGREQLTKWGTVDRAAQEAAAAAVLAKLGQTFSPRTTLGRLPLGQQQIVEIGRALVHKMRVLMMDEPTSALSASEIPILFRVMRDLTAHGVSIVYISHRLEELLAIADRVTVLRDGRVVGDAERRDIDVPWIVRRMTGREGRSDGPPSASSDAPVILIADRLGVPAVAGRVALTDVSLTLRAGEIVGVYGLMGAGRTELLESLFGVHADAVGAVRIGDRDVTGGDVAARIDAGLALVPEDRQASGLVPSFDVRRNVTLSSMRRLASFGYVSPAREAAAARPWLDRLHIKTQGLDAPIASLSGGNQQKVVIARGAMAQARVLLFDEPTRGVDVAAKADIVETMRQLAYAGAAILFATSDLSEIMMVATRALVMARGRITLDLPAGRFTEAQLASAASAAPATAEDGTLRVH